MIFKLLEKPIEITALVDENYSFAKEYFPIEPVVKHIPKWWKELLPKSQFDKATQTAKRTVKGCIGIHNTFKNGFILPMWSDLSIKYSSSEWSYIFSDETSKLDFHNNDQMPGFYSNYRFFKITSPWLLLANIDIKFATVDAFYLNIDKDYILPPGINETINKVCYTNIFLFSKPNTDRPYETIFINAGTPIHHIIPLTEQKVTVKNEVISSSEYKKLSTRLGSITFENKGLNIKNILAKRHKDKV